MEYYVTLSDGYKMPIVGLGTWLANNEEELTTAINSALEAGYRHFDTAWIYRNEHVLGKVLKEWLDSGRIKREDLFIVTKLPFCAMTPERVPEFIQKSLDNLNLKYLNLYLIHVPFGTLPLDPTTQLLQKDSNGQVKMDETTDLEAIWVAMEQQVGLGKTKSIGISNFDEEQIERIVKISKIKPVNLQVEMHVYFQQKSVRKICSKHGIKICAYSPLGNPGKKEMFEKAGLNFHPTSMLENSVVASIAKALGKTPAQILLRFLTQQGIIVIPKSVNPKRVLENFQCVDFKLNPSQMQMLEGLDQGDDGRTLNFNFLPGVEKHPEFPKSIIKSMK